MRLEMAFNRGSLIMFDERETLQHARVLLDHPLSTILDSRLVAAVECLAIRGEYSVHDLAPLTISVVLHAPFERAPPDGSTLVEKIAQLNEEMRIWELYWFDYYGTSTLLQPTMLILEPYSSTRRSRFAASPSVW